MLTIELNMYHAVALGAFLFWLGGIITDKISLLNRYCIPAPLVGGLCFSILNCILYSMGVASITFDATLQTVFMIMFFTTVGFTVSIPALLKGGKAVMLCLAISIVMIPLQNFLGGGVMALFGRDPLLGIGCGSNALVGGPGTAAAFGPDLEAAGAVGGSVVSIAAATFGLVAGSLMGGPTAKRLIEKHDLRPAPATVGGAAPSAALATDAASEDERFISDSPRFVKGFMLLLLAVGIGNQVSVWLTAITGLTFPAYIGAMLVAVVVHNVMDGVHVSYPAEEIDTMGNMFLSIFLAMALAGLKLWELVDLAMPMVICLVLQCVVMFLFSYFVVFNVMGRSYDAAVMLGFDLKDAASIGIIGAADGPTSILVSQVLHSNYVGPIAVAAYSYMALVPIIQPFAIKLVTTKKERAMHMPYNPKHVSRALRICFPIMVTIIAGFIAPMSVSLVGFLMFGNLLRECGCLERLSQTAQNDLANLITLLLGITISFSMQADQFVNLKTLIIMVLGLVAFVFDSIAGVMFAKLLNLFCKNKVNPMVGAAGISAFPMSARVIQKMGQEADCTNHLLMHAVGANVAGQIASVLAGGMILNLVPQLMG